MILPANGFDRLVDSVLKALPHDKEEVIHFLHLQVLQTVMNEADTFSSSIISSI